ncbi:signal-transducing adaptor protein 1 isoform X2 [Pseudophryne corroboree]|uniref:signal-transducing adaptor protein 1 isoform X2 n=1 Tax=Pseudophryne corroboree TaxID=495146 RepID=UPI0030813829
MAVVEPAPRRISQQRAKLTSLPLYYDGFLWIKRNKSNEMKCWTELRGNKLFLYNDKKQEKFNDCINLQSLVSVADEYPLQKQWAEVKLTLANEEVCIKTETAEDAEEWKGFILTVVELSVPTHLTLLPGQIIRLKEVLEKETSRSASQSYEEPILSPTVASACQPELYMDVANVNEMPLCFHNVSRQEAAEMLLKNGSHGNLILRPGADNKNFAVSILEPSENSRSPIKHYRIIRTDTNYIIELDKPVTLNTLDEVVQHFVTETRGKLKPFISNIYDTQIDCIVEESEGQKKSTESRTRMIAKQLSQGLNFNLQRGKENSYMNVLPGKKK